MDDRALNAAHVKHWITGGLFLERLLGNYGCGMVMLEAHWTDNPDVTADYVSARLDGYISEDTARRKMMAMVATGQATSRKAGRTVLFRLNADITEAAIAFIKGEQVKLP